MPVHSCYLRNLRYSVKGGVISKDIFTLVNRQKELRNNYLQLFNKLNETLDLTHLFENGTKAKIPSVIKSPLRFTLFVDRQNLAQENRLRNLEL